MNIHEYPKRTTWADLCRRPELELTFLESTVRNILTRVRQAGDEALKEFSLKFDHVQLTALELTAEEWTAGAKAVPASVKGAIELAARNIEMFHAAQKPSDVRVETMPGVACWRKSVPLNKVGIYIPGGSAPLFSTVLMLAIPARLAGCSEVILCTPPQRDGKIHPAILFAAQLSGVTRIFKTGGAQAIGALAYGTASIPRVDKIFGPGNQYVTAAKQMVSQQGVAIDMPAGPSEVLVIADDQARPDFVAADLLAQAEHGADSQVMLLTTSPELLRAVQGEVNRQLDSLSRKEMAGQALEHSHGVLLKNESDVIDFTNMYAPEHLIINTRQPQQIADRVVNAGSVFLGAFTPESAGDYASGTNHTLPTNGYARAWSGVTLESFMKTITYQQITPEGLRKLGPAVEIMAEAESLQAHKNAVTIRLKA
ncbi:MAG: histidinol dehydrogenase [Cyclobacteriaceae bacterium]|jgi:histidinol dehydrogenase